jgi:vacuolar-type H+-ATPase subunit H
MKLPLKLPLDVAVIAHRAQAFWAARKEARECLQQARLCWRIPHLQREHLEHARNEGRRARAAWVALCQA